MIQTKWLPKARMFMYECPCCSRDDFATLDGFGRPDEVGDEVCPFCGREMEDVISLNRNRRYRLYHHYGIDGFTAYGPRGNRRCSG